MKDQPWYTYVLLAIIIFMFSYFLYFKPKNNAIKNTRDERIRIENDVVKLRTKQRQLTKIENEIKGMTAKLGELEAIIPDTEEIYGILKRFQQLAYDTRLDIKKFDPKGLIKKEFFSEKPISIEATGNYHNLAIFFDRLRNFSRLFTIEDFSIKAIQNQSEDRTITANWTAKTFIVHDMPPPKKADQKRPKPGKPGKRQ